MRQVNALLEVKLSAELQKTNRSKEHFDAMLASKTAKDPHFNWEQFMQEVDNDSDEGLDNHTESLVVNGEANDDDSGFEAADEYYKFADGEEYLWDSENMFTQN